MNDIDYIAKAKLEEYSADAERMRIIDQGIKDLKLFINYLKTRETDSLGYVKHTFIGDDTYTAIEGEDSEVTISRAKSTFLYKYFGL